MDARLKHRLALGVRFFRITQRGVKGSNGGCNRPTLEKGTGEADPARSDAGAALNYRLFNRRS